MFAGDALMMTFVWTGIALWLGLNAAIALRCLFLHGSRQIDAMADRPHLRLV